MSSSREKGEGRELSVEAHGPSGFIGPIENNGGQKNNSTGLYIAASQKYNECQEGNTLVGLFSMPCQQAQVI